MNRRTCFRASHFDDKMKATCFLPALKIVGGNRQSTFFSKKYLVLLRCELGPKRSGTRSRGRPALLYKVA
jgi:hypothetical protein